MDELNRKLDAAEKTKETEPSMILWGRCEKCGAKVEFQTLDLVRTCPVCGYRGVTRR